MKIECQYCGKEDWDDPRGCLNARYLSASVGDWVCMKKGPPPESDSPKSSKPTEQPENSAFQEEKQDLILSICALLEDNNIIVDGRAEHEIKTLIIACSRLVGMEIAVDMVPIDEIKREMERRK